MSIPYDRTFKLLADDDPRAALAAFAGIPLDADIEVRPVDRELNISTLRVDNLYLCRQAREEFLVHFEAVSRYRHEVLDWQVDYVRGIISKYRLPCRSYLLLLTEGGVPERLPRYLESRFGDYDSRLRLRVVRLWKIPARRILRLGRMTLLPWIALMKASEEEMADAARQLAQGRHGGLTAQMALLMGLRYGKKELFEERLAGMTTEEIIQDSYFYHWILEKGEKIGVEKGEKIGVEKGEKIGEKSGIRHALSQQLTVRFGPLPPWARERLAAADIDTLNRWTINVLSASSLEDCLR